MNPSARLRKVYLPSPEGELSLNFQEAFPTVPIWYNLQYCIVSNCLSTNLGAHQVLKILVLIIMCIIISIFFTKTLLLSKSTQFNMIVTGIYLDIRTYIWKCQAKFQYNPRKVKQEINVSCPKTIGRPKIWAKEFKIN